MKFTLTAEIEIEIDPKKPPDDGKLLSIMQDLLTIAMQHQTNRKLDGITIMDATPIAVSHT